jgi:hypothetical protein
MTRSGGLPPSGDYAYEVKREVGRVLGRRLYHPLVACPNPTPTD